MLYYQITPTTKTIPIAILQHFGNPEAEWIVVPLHHTPYQQQNTTTRINDMHTLYISSNGHTHHRDTFQECHVQNNQNEIGESNDFFNKIILYLALTLHLSLPSSPKSFPWRPCLSQLSCWPLSRACPGLGRYQIYWPGHEWVLGMKLLGKQQG